MGLEDYRNDLSACTRCSACKFIPFEKVSGFQNVNICPSIARYNFHAYSGGGRLDIGMSLLNNNLEYTDKVREIIYNCQMCGACDIACKYGMDMEVLVPLNEMRFECVERGITLPALDEIIAHLKQDGSLLSESNTPDGNWYDGLDVRDYTTEKVEVIYHAGCRTVHDSEMWDIARSNITLLNKAGIEAGIDYQEICCGGRAYEMGYKAEALKQAQLKMERIQQSGAKVLVTGCADCYHAFKVLYDKFGVKGDLKVLHITEYLNGLIQDGRIQPKKNIDMTVTYHDPCHLGRLGEPYSHWQGKQLPGHVILFDPPKNFNRGTYGIYDPPREILLSLPGLKLLEMDRIKEYAWCCGAGGGVKESNPEFAQWTARERIQEANATGADALVTACPGCKKILQEAIADTQSSLKIFDVIELLAKTV